MPQGSAEATASQSTCQKRYDRCQRRGNRKILSIGDGEPQEYNIPRHVGHEDVTKAEIADGIDESGDHREHEKQRRKGTVSFVAPRHGISRT
jgi:hypothetical protein